MLPFPDETREAKNVLLKAWVCPNCYAGLTMKSGVIEADLFSITKIG